MIVGLASISAVKKRAVELALGNKLNLLICNASPSGIANQPVGYKNGILGAMNRMTYAKEHLPPCEVYISIENFIEQYTSNWFDAAIVVVSVPATDLNDEIIIVPGKENRTVFPTEFAVKASLSGEANGGFNTTVGEIINPKSPTDWHVAYPPYKSRVDLLVELIQGGLKKHDLF